MSWPLVRLGDIFEITSSKRVHQKDWRTEGIPFYRAREIAVLSREGEVDNDLFIDEPMYEEYKSKFGAPEEGDILVTAVGTLGLTYAVKKGERFYFKDASVIKLRKKIDVDISYIQYAIASPKVQGFIQNSSGATVGTYTISRARETEIPLPPLKEQKRIAAILDKADAIRRKRQKAIDLADDFLRSVFLDMFGDPVTNPKGWEVKKLSEISSKIASGNTPKGGSKNYVDEGITFLRSQNVWKNKILLDDVVYIDQKTHDSMSKSSLKNKDILMTKTGRINTENSSLGRAALYLGEDGKANLNGHVYFIRLVEDILHEFIVFILTTKEYRDYIRSVCVGGIDKRQLNKDHLEDFPIIYPPKEMQKQFVDKVNIARNMVKKARVGLQESEQMFNALSQQAFSGEL